jgi:hypothetical protein
MVWEPPDRVQLGPRIHCNLWPAHQLNPESGRVHHPAKVASHRGPRSRRRDRIVAIEVGLAVGRAEKPQASGANPTPRGSVDPRDSTLKAFYIGRADKRRRVARAKAGL